MIEISVVYSIWQTTTRSLVETFARPPDARVADSIVPGVRADLLQRHVRPIPARRANVHFGEKLLRLDLGGAIDNDSHRTVFVVMKEQSDRLSEEIAVHQVMMMPTTEQSQAMRRDVYPKGRVLTRCPNHLIAFSVFSVHGWP